MLPYSLFHGVVPFRSCATFRAGELFSLLRLEGEGEIFSFALYGYDLMILDFQCLFYDVFDMHGESPGNE